MIQMTAQCDECREITPVRGLTTEAIRDRLLARFQKHVHKSLDGCWEWQGYKKNGYGFT
jgi:hypothetical protein